MKNMKDKLMDEVKQGIARVVGDAAMKVGEMAIDTQCRGFSYETEVPQELLKHKLSER